MRKISVKAKINKSIMVEHVDARGFIENKLAVAIAQEILKGENMVIHEEDKIDVQGEVVITAETYVMTPNDFEYMLNLAGSIKELLTAAGWVYAETLVSMLQNSKENKTKDDYGRQ